MVIKFFLILIYLIGSDVIACHLNTSIVSLSGPVTMVLEELDLLEDKNLKALSSFHPIIKKTQAEILAGGIFLSKKTIKDYQDEVLFFDKSVELSNLLKKFKKNNFIELDTSGKDSFSVAKDILEQISPYLEACSEKTDALISKLDKIKNELGQMQSQMILFFLGQIKTKYPQLIMGRDGLVLTLIQMKKIQTYESPLTYIQWSAKEMKNYKTFLKVGLLESQSNTIQVEKVNELTYNLSFRGVLVPGIRQVYFLKEFSKLSLN